MLPLESPLTLLDLGEIAITPENFFALGSFQCYSYKPCRQIKQFVHFSITPFFGWTNCNKPYLKNINSGHRSITPEKWTKGLQHRKSPILLIWPRYNTDFPQKNHVIASRRPHVEALASKLLWHKLQKPSIGNKKQLLHSCV
jgi:hypothetical protein